jgi:hypothetical protein
VKGNQIENSQFISSTKAPTILSLNECVYNFAIGPQLSASSLVPENAVSLCGRINQDLRLQLREVIEVSFEQLDSMFNIVSSSMILVVSC